MMPSNREDEILIEEVNLHGKWIHDIGRIDRKDLDMELKGFRGSDHAKEVVERVLNQLNSMKNIIKEAKQAESSDNKQNNGDNNTKG
jgi:hypothetical protein